jgi:hypothetical protein
MRSDRYGWYKCLEGMLRVLIPGLLVFLSSGRTFAQQDSLYHKLEEKADRHKVTGWIFDAIFEDPDKVRRDGDTVIKTVSTREKKVANAYLPYAGKPISSVTIEVVDPFGYSVHDTLKQPTQRIQRIGNRYHVTTRKRVIKNLLLFEEGDKVDPIKLSESERLLRQAPYINDARIYVRKNKNARDSLQILVIVHDKWSLEPESNFDISKPDFFITENNFGGVGHQLREGVGYDVANNRLSNSGRYGIYNIRNTYISSALSYYYDNLLTSFTLSLDRPFYSPLARYAGGLALSKSYAHFLYEDTIRQTESLFPLDFATVDIWAGRNFRVGNRRKLKDRVSNILTGARYFNQQYQERPQQDYDPHNTLRDESLYLVNVGYSSTKYYKDRYISRFGANEDIPLGFAVQLVSGYRQRELEANRYYAGFSVSSSRLFSKIYLQTTLAYGTFYNRYSTEQGVASIELFGFSNLAQFGRWYFRQFARFKYLQGIDRNAIENITLNPSEMYGFNSETLLAKSKVLVNLQTIIYTPYNVIGFRFAPVIMMGFGQVGNGFSDVFEGRVYQAYSFGLLIRNENLLFNTFEVTLGIYPNIPDGGKVTGNMSSGRRTPFTNMSIGRPDVIPYN